MDCEPSVYVLLQFVSKCAVLEVAQTENFTDFKS